MSIIWVFLESLEYWTLLGAWLELESEAHTIWAKLSVSCARNGSFFYLIILRLSGRAIKSQILCLYFSETGKWIKLGPNNSNSSHDHFRSHFPKLSHSSKNCHIHYHFFCLDISLLLIFIRPKQTTGRATDQGSTEDNRVTVTWQDHTRDKDEIVITIQEKTFIINHQL